MCTSLCYRQTEARAVLLSICLPVSVLILLLSLSFPWLTVAEVQSVITMVGGMAACRQTYAGEGAECYIWMHR